jgi:hypothetical protein
MNDPKVTNAPPAANPDQLIDSGFSTSGELSDQALDGVTGGSGRAVQDVVENKHKVAIKAADAFDAYIRS